MEWRTVQEAPEYEVSEGGEIRSVYSRRPLVGGIDKDGYRKIVLCTGGGRIHRRVSALVCEAFHGPRQPGQVVRHRDGTRTNDAAVNLEWGTQKQNIADKIAHGTAQIGVKHPQAKLNDAAVLDIRTSTERNGVLAERYGVKAVTISAVRHRRLWAHVH